MGDNYESFYVGGASSLSPDFGNYTGYRLNAARIGAPTSIQTANQLSEVLARIREGAKNVELQPLQGDVFDQIPKEHFKEIAAISKLTGVKPSVHAPIIDAAGFGEKGWDGETARQDAERKLFSVIERSHELDPNGNIPIVIHSTAGVPGNEYRPGKDENGNEIKPGKDGRFYEKKIALIDQESRQVTAVQEEKRFRPYGMHEENWKEGQVISAEKFLVSVNKNQWDQKATNLAFYQKESDKVFDNLNKGLATSGLLDIGGKNILSKEEYQKLGPIGTDLSRANLFFENNEMTFNTLFSNAYKYGDENLKKDLKKIHDNYTKDMKNFALEAESINNPIRIFSKRSELFNKYSAQFMDKTRENPPELLVPVEEFARKKSAETFGNVAFKAYEKFEDNAPMLAIENMFQGMAFSKADEMKKLVDDSRKNFANKLMEEKGMGENEAKETAKKLIGVTWDVGHLNMMKKAGFNDEDIAKETEKIAKYVKHVHLTDNFGYSDSHLVPGMGNVPFKKILEQLEKAGTLDKARKIVEAGAFVQHFKKSPHSYVMSAFGSPIYGMKAAPYWNQIAEGSGGYFSSPLAYMPEKHFSMYGSGFSMLPQELGGQIPGNQSRFSGTPNA